MSAFVSRLRLADFRKFDAVAGGIMSDQLTPARVAEAWAVYKGVAQATETAPPWNMTEKALLDLAALCRLQHETLVLMFDLIDDAEPGDRRRVWETIALMPPKDG